MLRDELKRLGKPELADPIERLMGLVGDVGILENAAKILGKAGRESLDYLRQLDAALAQYGISPSDYAFDMGVVRGLDYYTGMVFEIDSPNLGAENKVGGGGSYALAEVFGGDAVPQTGFALGLDRLVMAADAEEVATPFDRLDAYIIPIGEAVRGRSVELLARLRASGLRADIDLVGRGPSKNLDYANAISARYAILLGERELKGNAVALRDMATGEQKQVSLESLVEAIAKKSGSTA
jgi:histidyl-tRNA synthetase